MASIRNEMLHGVFWSAIEKYSGLVVGILVSMILARLLNPEEFGVVAIATVLIQFLSMFCTMGIAPAIIQREDLNNEDLDNIFTLTLLVGLIFSVAFFFCSWPIASFYGNKQLIPVCQILSVQLFFSAANMVPNALMNKYKRFKEIAKRTLFLQIVSCTLAITAAYNGFGVYSLLISPVLTAIGIFLFNRCFYRVRLNLPLSLNPIRRIFSFAVYEFLFEFVNYFSRNLDKLIIGRYMSVSNLGYYEKSYRLMQLPMNNVTAVINPILQPVLSKLQNNPEQIAIEYNKIIRLISTISFPVGIILSFSATEIIHLFYGNNWDMAVPVFSILSLSLPLQMIQSTSGGIFLVANDAKGQFWVGIRNTITTVTGFMIAAIYFGTIEAMAWAWDITLLVNFIFTYYALYHFTLKSSIWIIIRELINPFFLAICLIFTFLLLSRFLEYTPIFFNAAVKIGLGSIISLLFIQITKRYNLWQFFLNLLSKKKKN